MRRSGLLSVALAGALAAGVAMAADPGASEGRMGAQGQPGYDGGGARAGAATRTAGFAGQHQMTGTVTDIDKSAGRVTLNAEGQQLQLHFPQQALQRIDRGDRVTVSLGIRQASGGGPGTTGAPGSGAVRGTGGGSGAPGDPGGGHGSGTLGHVAPSGEGATGTMNR